MHRPVGNGATAARVTVPVDEDRTPEATLAVAATLARQGGIGVEFVTTAGRRRADPAAELRARCRAAIGAGAPHASWTVLDRAAGGVTWYSTWSGSTVLCSGVRRHGPHAGALMPALHGGGLPVVVVGPRLGPCPSTFGRLIVALDGSPNGVVIATAAADVGQQLGLDIVFAEVVPCAGVGGDVHESAYLHGIVRAVHCPGSSFDILHGRRPADGIVDFAGHEGRAIIAVGVPATARHGRMTGGHVARAVVRHAECPVLVIPTGAAGASAQGDVAAQVREAS